MFDWFYIWIGKRSGLTVWQLMAYWFMGLFTPIPPPDDDEERRGQKDDD